MKKVLFVFALALGSMTAFAQEEAPATEENATEENATEAVATQDGFSEISLEEVPEAVTVMLEKNYPGATINKAHKNEENQYKLEVALEDGTVGALIVDEEGNAIEQ